MQNVHLATSWLSRTRSLFLGPIRWVGQSVENILYVLPSVEKEQCLSLGILCDALSFEEELEGSFPTPPSWTNASWVAFAIERTNVSKFDVYRHFRYFSSRTLLTIGFHPRRQL